MVSREREKEKGSGMMMGSANEKWAANGKAGKGIACITIAEQGRTGFSDSSASYLL